MSAADTEDTDDFALAGEYVLHLLDPAERRIVEDRMAIEQPLREMVRDWDARLAPMADEIALVAPPASVKAALQQRLFGKATSPERGFLWRWLSGGALAAVVMVGAVLITPMLMQPDPTYSASVAAEDGSLVIAAGFFEDDSSLHIVRETGAARPGRVLELWLIAEGAEAPVSLGVLPDETPAIIEVSEDLAAQLQGGVLAVSDEPPGGSPTGAPTGDVLAAGAVTDA